jgi:hypothetical protein
MTEQLVALAAGSDNFRFLLQHDLRLAIDAAAAEIYLYSDPDAALGKIRRFGETLARLISDQAGLSTRNQTQHQRIRALQAAGAIPSTMKNLLDTVRSSGNSAVHEASTTGRDALPALEACFEMGVWWNARLAGPRLTHSFSRPIAAPSTTERMNSLIQGLEAQIDRLHAEFSDPRPAASLLISPAPIRTGAWEGGAKISCRGRAYLLHDPVHTVYASDGSWELREAGGLSFGVRADPVWLRGVAVFMDGPGAAGVTDGLHVQARFLTEANGRKGLPKIDMSDSAVVVTGRTPGPTWREHFGTGQDTGPLDRYVVPLALQALAPVAAALAELHLSGHAHRSIGPDSVVVSGRQGRLRDAGLAGFPRLPGEGGEYAAPEQKVLAGGVRPEPPTDVFQVGALLLHTLLGYRPLPDQALDSRLPPDLDALVRAALDRDSTRRPRMSTLAAALYRAERTLSPRSQP